MPVEIATHATPELTDAMARLIPQLSTKTPLLSQAQVAAVVDQPGVFVFVFRPDEAAADGSRPILGLLTLAMFRIPTGLRAWIEDVVVDGEARGQGAGRALNQAALEHAKLMGARTVELTSRPSREAANHLYKSIGFEIRETNVYRFELDG